MARRAAIVGVADTPLRDGVLAEDGTVLQVQARAAKAALDEAGLALRDVDALFAAGSWGVPGPGHSRLLPDVGGSAASPRAADIKSHEPIR
jgi:acetyl-CoA acetyltransferase